MGACISLLLKYPYFTHCSVVPKQFVAGKQLTKIEEAAFICHVYITAC